MGVVGRTVDHAGLADRTEFDEFDERIFQGLIVEESASAGIVVAIGDLKRGFRSALSDP